MTTRVLYLEDEPDIAEVTAMALEMIGGYELRHCDRGAAALAEAERFKPDLCLFDVMMPGIDGVATYRALRARDGANAPPVVFLTAKAQLHEQAAYLDEGALGVIVKPFDPVELCAKLEGLMALKPPGDGDPPPAPDA
ncbi:response regulator [Rhodovulum sp. DZ06]|uniref:response regulator n=1 Tax=Rhodovulum sp. DZ06 TaxID=3425126 RepID=UPI003D352365